MKVLTDPTKNNLFPDTSLQNQKHSSPKEEKKKKDLAPASKDLSVHAWMNAAEHLLFVFG